uniref:IREH1/IRE-like N-terminal domain-containing protein n=1 Tax=Opuntia streptacantha TaxID=393608 RepID=A0A7C8Z2L6_OPUST
MVFKARFFSSKKSDSSSPDGSNSPRSSRFNSPIRSDKKKPTKYSDKLEDSQITSSSSSASSTRGFPDHQLKDPSSKKNHGKGKAAQIEPSDKPSTTQKLDAGVPASGSPAAAVSPILASSLGLNKIKTRSGPLPQETFFGFRSEKGVGLGSSNLSRPTYAGSSGGKQETGWLENVVESGSNSDGMSPGSGHSTGLSPNPGSAGQIQGRSRLSSGGGNLNTSWEQSSGTKSPEMSYDYETPKESESPRFQAILRVTSGPRKRFPSDIKSFSHELNSKGVRPFPFWKPRGLNNLEEVLVMIRGKFEKAKEEVDSDLAIFAADLVGVLEKNAESHPEWQEAIEDLLILARSCAMTSPNEFWLQCEGIAQDLDDRRQELPQGTLKQLHTRMLFILTRCTRLLQFHKESGFAEEGL